MVLLYFLCLKLSVNDWIGATPPGPRHAPYFGNTRLVITHFLIITLYKERKNADFSYISFENSLSSKIETYTIYLPSFCQKSFWKGPTGFSISKGQILKVKTIVSNKSGKKISIELISNKQSDYNAM